MIVSEMANHEARLDGVFLALSDATRRAVLARLSLGPASVGELAAPFAMALPSFLKHIRVLERSGCIRTDKRGRIRQCALRADAFAVPQRWLIAQQRVWEDRTDRLAHLVTTARGPRKGTHE